VSARGGQTVADLELIVVSKNPADVTGMILTMDRMGIFQSELVEQNLQKDRNEVGTESTLRVLYQPRGGVPTTTTGDNNVAAANAAQAMNVETR
jgi:hypothetical protein